MTHAREPVPALSLTGVGVRRGARTVVHDVDLEVGRGEVVALLGPNGAGKSTVLEAAGGVLPVATGSIAIEGRVASVLQQPGLARRSARANVELALAWWGVPHRDRRLRAMEALELMRATALAGRPVTSLSGGERRRVHVARGLAVGADVLLLDEPFAGLDPETRELLAEDTAVALRSAGSAVLVVVHERAEAWALADRLVVLMGGRVVASGTPGALLDAPPDPDVARFLGYDGELRRDGRLLLTRAIHVRLDAAGDLGGRVTRVVRQQDGVRVDIETAYGAIRALHPGLAPTPAPVVGDQICVRVDGGATYPP